MSVESVRYSDEADMGPLIAAILSKAPYVRRSRTLLNYTSAMLKSHSSQELPRLPVPALEKTVEKFLTTAKPHLDEKEFETTKSLIQRFVREGGTGPELQRLLEERARGKENWLEEWWLNSAYLDYRNPVVVFSSPGLVFPFVEFKSEDERLAYTANLILAALDYKSMIDRDAIPVEMSGKSPLDMGQYKKILGTCRIPGRSRDSVRFHPDSKHVVVARNGHFFKLPVYGCDGKVLSLRQLMVRLLDISSRSETKAENAVGILTCDDRDTWGGIYSEMIKECTNKKSLEEIERSLFLVCLDEPLCGTDEDKDVKASKQLIHGGGSKFNAGNRWFDKTLQFIISPDGINGLTYEHSPSEGQPVAVMVDHLINFIAKCAGKDIPDADVKECPEKLVFCVDDLTRKYIALAKLGIDRLAEDLDVASFTYKAYGKDFIKSQKLSPDSYIQIAMQLTFYRIHNVPGAHYESAATRKYIHGRTETIRSCSLESVAFAKAMCDNKATPEEKIKLMKEAINSHRKYAMEAVNGHGVDRHLLGLKLTALENRMDVPAFYFDPGYTRSLNMRVSSSQVATKCDGYMAYGPLTKDGYACCYNPRPDDIKFGITAHHSCPDTTAAQFRDAMRDSLDDMQNLLLSQPKAKL